MNRVLSLTFFLFFLNVTFLSAQGWEQTFGAEADDLGSFILPISGGNYLVKGTTNTAFGTGGRSAFILKINGNGELIWQKFIPCDNENGEIVAWSDDTYLTVVDNDIQHSLGNVIVRPKFVKFDEDGNTLWEYYSSFFTGQDAQVNSLVPLADGSLLFMVKTELDNVSTYRIGKFDSDGNLLYLNELPTEVRSNRVVAFDETSYTLLGSINATTIGVWTIDAEGNLLNSKEYLDVPVADYYFLAENEELIYFQANIDLIAQGRINTDGLVIDVDTIWTGETFNLGTPPTQLEDGFISTGFVVGSSSEPYSLGLIRTDFTGNVIWTQVHDYFPYLQVGRYATPAHDEGFMVTGYSRPSFIGTDATVFKTDTIGRVYSNALTGNVSVDSTLNCLIDAGERRLEDWIITAERADRIFSTTSDQYGNYFLPLDSGNYVVNLQPINPYWESCINEVDIEFVGFNNEEVLDFPIQTAYECPNMVINSSVLAIRPCFTRSNYVSYCNNGTVTAEDAYIDITYDSLITPLSSSFPWDSLGGNTYRFNLGDIEPFECGNFSVGLFLDCAAEVGVAYCIEAHAYPDSICVPDLPTWSGAFLEVTGACEDDTLFFQIKNIGDAPMDEFSEYIIVEDAILLNIDSVELGVGASENFVLPGNGSTFVVMAEQVEDAPGDPYPIAVIEGCGESGDGTFSIGFTNQFPLNDLNQFYDIDCPVATNSFDPNDKQASPEGFGEEHYILPDVTLEYKIRFQNTGTDTAFTVVIKDTLDQKLDITTFERGASSHQYDFSINGEGILIFDFQNIMLPDSNVNEAASHGFVEFKIKPIKDIAPGTVIKNDAAIYFDFNPPIFTNEIFHTIAEDFMFVTVGTTQHPTQSNIEVAVYPNPMVDRATFEIENHRASSYRLEIFDFKGNLLRQEEYMESTFVFDRKGLHAGMYFYRLTASDGLVNTGTIISIEH